MNQSNSKVKFIHKIMILNTLTEINNATCNELENILDLPHQTVSARLTDLQKINRIYDTGERRLTKFGRPARVYAVTPEIKPSFFGKIFNYFNER